MLIACDDKGEGGGGGGGGGGCLLSVAIAFNVILRSNVQSSNWRHSLTNPRLPFRDC